jgi:hypothetical protein
MLRQSLRQGRFRHRLLEPEFLKTHSEKLALSVAKLREKHAALGFGDEDFVGLYLLLFINARRPKDFLGGPHGFELPPLTSGLRMHEAIKILCEIAPQQNWTKLERLPTEGLFIENICRVSWRSIPFSAQRALHCWMAGAYPLKRMTHLPPPEEVLMFQCEGYRCVSTLCEARQISTYVEEGRDVLGFVVHDLIHADHFFHDKGLAEAQIQFSRRLQKIHGTTWLQEMLNQDSAFMHEWNYLISDMNSVPLHLLMTLKATLLGFFKRQNNIDVSHQLPEHLESNFMDIFNKALALWHFSPIAHMAAQRLNTPQSQGHQDNLILTEALALRS